MNDDTISLDEAFKQIDARRKIENPWTEADEARREAKSKAEREARDRWLETHPPEPEEPDDEEEEEEEEDGDEEE